PRRRGEALRLSRPLARAHPPTLKFLSPRRCDVWYVKSPPSSQLPLRPSGSPAVAITPARDSPNTFSRTRRTPIVVAGATSGSSRVLTTRAPKFVAPARPVVLSPARIGTF